MYIFYICKHKNGITINFNQGNQDASTKSIDES